jgi:hypothetical protein
LNSSHEPTKAYGAAIASVREPSAAYVSYQLAAYSYQS